MNLYGQFSCDFYESLPIPQNPTYRKSLASRFLNPSGSGDDVPAEIIWDIVCRWHGMRILYSLYCDSAINKAYLSSAFPSEVLADEINDEMASESALPPPSGPISASFKEMSTKQRQQSYQRFYKAVITHWNPVEMLWLVRTQVFPNAREFDKTFERTWDIWDNNPTRSVSDKIDIIEVVDFVWGFLGRKAFHLSSVPDWLEGQDEDVLSRYLLVNEREVDNWGFFVRDIFQYLRPVHVIELLLWTWNSLRWNFNRPGFLQRLGLFDMREGIHEDPSGRSRADNWVPITTVVKDIESSFAHREGVATLVSQWYRSNRWPLDARARVFFRGPMTKELFIQLIGNRLPD